MRIHHLNCATMCPPGGHLMGGPRPGLGPARLTCHCLLIETEQGLVLVDTGLGLHDVAAPVPRLSRVFVALMRPRLDPEETAVRQIERLGLSPRDVRHIVLTHLDFDHAGGLDDFPGATVHVLAAEVGAARDRHTLVERGRYRPPQWSAEVAWQTYEAAAGEPWFGFGCVRGLVGLPPEILLVPLPGHTRGHCGVAIRRPAGWLLHAGDAYFFRGEVDPIAPSCPVGLRLYQAVLADDRAARAANLRRLRALVRSHGDEVALTCSHDPVEFEAWVALSLRERRSHVRLVSSAEG